MEKVEPVKAPPLISLTPAEIERCRELLVMMRDRRFVCPESAGEDLFDVWLIDKLARWLERNQ